MRKACSLLLALFAVTSFLVPRAAAQTAKQPFALTLSTDSPSVKAGSDVWVKVTMTNLSNHDVNCAVWSSNGVDLNYMFDVRDGNGTAPPKKTSKHPEIEGAGSIGLCTLSPGQSTTPEDNLISRLFHMEKPGQYTVQVSRQASEDPHAGKVSSNTMNITVTP